MCACPVAAGWDTVAVTGLHQICHPLFLQFTVFSLPCLALSCLACFLAVPYPSNSVSTALSKGTGKLKRRLKATATTSQQQQQQQQQQPATSFFQPATSFFPPPSPAPSDAPDLPSLPAPKLPTPTKSPTTAAATAVGEAFSSAAGSEPLASSSSSSSLFNLATPGGDNDNGPLAFQSVAEFSPTVAPEGRRGSFGGFGGDEETVAEEGDAGASSPPGGFLKVRVVSCYIGSLP